MCEYTYLSGSISTGSSCLAFDERRRTSSRSGPVEQPEREREPQSKPQPSDLHRLILAARRAFANRNSLSPPTLCAVFCCE
ncbi:hypothetical protein M5D96_009508 [Drosophila gunungcola]|uniref:Uncharacterized protein n=1 Tax=Drosophila gunungcola TaxID=103775 RepID=A0A9P9YI14_9MUSC|nr:hypothetical protein M5D96_009508 [Drosophila gunungcola]